MKHSLTHTARLALSLLALMLSTLAFAAPQVGLEIIAEKDVVETNERGDDVVRRVVTADAAPGDILFYTLRYRNSGSEAARNVQIDNPVPEGTAFNAGSAWGDGADILFSIDGGNSYRKPVHLTYEITERSGEKRQLQAPPEQYNAVRWTVTDIPAGAEGSVGFSVTVQ
jgi:uncharacterized repeat protein (TIGR01451 family)